MISLKYNDDIKENKKRFWSLCYNYIDNRNSYDYNSLKDLVDYFEENDSSFYRLSINVLKVLNIEFDDKK